MPPPITKRPRSNCGVILPDLPGGITACRTIDDGVEMAREGAKTNGSKFRRKRSNAIGWTACREKL